MATVRFQRLACELVTLFNDDEVSDLTLHYPRSWDTTITNVEDDHAVVWVTSVYDDGQDTVTRFAWCDDVDVSWSEEFPPER